MGKRAPTIGTLLALTFLCSLLAMALVGGGVRPSLDRIEPLPGEAREGRVVAPLPPSGPGVTAPFDSAVELIAFTSENPGPPGGKGSGGSEVEETVEGEPPVEPQPGDSTVVVGSGDGQDDDPQPDGRPEQDREGRRPRHGESRPRIRESPRPEEDVGRASVDPVGVEVDLQVPGHQDQDRNAPR